MHFDQPGILDLLEQALPEVLDRAEFGIIRMGLDGVVQAYNRAESELSGLSPDKVIGRHFFTDVAPCTNNFMVAQRFLDQATLDQTIDYVFTFRIRPTAVRLRLLRSPAAPSMYLLVQKRAA